MYILTVGINAERGNEVSIVSWKLADFAHFDTSLLRKGASNVGLLVDRRVRMTTLRGGKSRTVILARPSREA